MRSVSSPRSENRQFRSNFHPCLTTTQTSMSSGLIRSSSVHEAMTFHRSGLELQSIVSLPSHPHSMEPSSFIHDGMAGTTPPLPDPLEEDPAARQEWCQCILKPLHTPGLRYAQLSPEAGHFLTSIRSRTSIESDGPSQSEKKIIKGAAFRYEPLATRWITWTHGTIGSEHRYFQ